MLSVRAIQVIQRIKDSTEDPLWHAWLMHVRPRYARQCSADRLIDASSRIMYLLRNELPPQSVIEYNRLYNLANTAPQRWGKECLEAAEKLWRYVLALDQWVSQIGIASAAARPLPPPPVQYDQTSQPAGPRSPPGELPPPERPQPTLDVVAATPVPLASSWCLPPILYSTSIVPALYTGFTVPAMYTGWCAVHVPMQSYPARAVE